MADSRMDQFDVLERITAKNPDKPAELNKKLVAYVKTLAAWFNAKKDRTEFHVATNQFESTLEFAKLDEYMHEDVMKKKIKNGHESHLSMGPSPHTTNAEAYTLLLQKLLQLSNIKEKMPNVPEFILVDFTHQDRDLQGNDTTNGITKRNHDEIEVVFTDKKNGQNFKWIFVVTFDEHLKKTHPTTDLFTCRISRTIDVPDSPPESDSDSTALSDADVSGNADVRDEVKENFDFKARLKIHYKDDQILQRTVCWEAIKQCIKSNIKTIQGHAYYDKGNNKLTLSNAILQTYLLEENDISSDTNSQQYTKMLEYCVDESILLKGKRRNGASWNPTLIEYQKTAIKQTRSNIQRHEHTLTVQAVYSGICYELKFVLISQNASGEQSITSLKCYIKTVPAAAPRRSPSPAGSASSGRAPSVASGGGGGAGGKPWSVTPLLAVGPEKSVTPVMPGPHPAGGAGGAPIAGPKVGVAGVVDDFDIRTRMEEKLPANAANNYNLMNRKITANFESAFLFLPTTTDVATMTHAAVNARMDLYLMQTSTDDDSKLNVDEYDNLLSNCMKSSVIGPQTSDRELWNPTSIVCDRKPTFVGGDSTLYSEDTLTVHATSSTGSWTFKLLRVSHVTVDKGNSTRTTLRLHCTITRQGLVSPAVNPGAAVTASVKAPVVQISTVKKEDGSSAGAAARAKSPVPTSPVPSPATVPPTAAASPSKAAGGGGDGGGAKAGPVSVDPPAVKPILDDPAAERAESPGDEFHDANEVDTAVADDFDLREVLQEQFRDEASTNTSFQFQRDNYFNWFENYVLNNFKSAFGNRMTKSKTDRELKLYLQNESLIRTDKNNAYTYNAMLTQCLYLSKFSAEMPDEYSWSPTSILCEQEYSGGSVFSRTYLNETLTVEATADVPGKSSAGSWKFILAAQTHRSDKTTTFQFNISKIADVAGASGPSPAGVVVKSEEGAAAGGWSTGLSNGLSRFKFWSSTVKKEVETIEAKIQASIAPDAASPGADASTKAPDAKMHSDALSVEMARVRVEREAKTLIENTRKLEEKRLQMEEETKRIALEAEALRVKKIEDEKVRLHLKAEQVAAAQVVKDAEAVLLKATQDKQKAEQDAAAAAKTAAELLATSASKSALHEAELLCISTRIDLQAKKMEEEKAETQAHRASETAARLEERQQRNELAIRNDAKQQERVEELRQETQREVTVVVQQMVEYVKQITDKATQESEKTNLQIIKLITALEKKLADMPTGGPGAPPADAHLAAQIAKLQHDNSEYQKAYSDLIDSVASVEGTSGRRVSPSTHKKFRSTIMKARQTSEEGKVVNAGLASILRMHPGHHGGRARPLSIKEDCWSVRCESDSEIQDLIEELFERKHDNARVKLLGEKLCAFLGLTKQTFTVIKKFGTSEYNVRPQEQDNECIFAIFEKHIHSRAEYEVLYFGREKPKVNSSVQEWPPQDWILVDLMQDE